MFHSMCYWDITALFGQHHAWNLRPMSFRWLSWFTKITHWNIVNMVTPLTFSPFTMWEQMFWRKLCQYSIRFFYPIFHLCKRTSVLMTEWPLPLLSPLLPSCCGLLASSTMSTASLSNLSSRISTRMVGKVWRRASETNKTMGYTNIKLT